VDWRRVLLATVLLATALVLQLTLLSRLRLPGATPDLVTVVVVALALAFGPGTGAVAGFAAGLALDLVPPADGVVGTTALVLAVVGYAAGSVLDPVDRPVLPAIAVVAVSAGAVVLGSAVLTSLLGGSRVIWDDVPSMVLASVLYAAFLAPFVVPAVDALARRLDPVTR
jgi:rod shape-determining protein MreD